MQKMIRYSVEPRDRIFVKGNGLLSFDKEMGKHIGKKEEKYEL